MRSPAAALVRTDVRTPGSRRAEGEVGHRRRCPARAQAGRGVRSDGAARSDRGSCQAPR